MWLRRAILLGVILIWLSGCARGGVMLQAGAPASFSPWHDGTYTGMLDLPTPQFLVVEVDITQGQIVAIRLQQHPAWKAPEEQELLLHRVLERQTTNVEALREEGSEQDLLLRAIEDALSKAQREAPLRP